MNYVAKVADLFLSRCQNIKILDPMDYTIIAEWEKQEIPLAVVMDSINQAFDNLPPEANIESITHFQTGVGKDFADWLYNLKIVP